MSKIGSEPAHVVARQLHDPEGRRPYRRTRYTLSLCALAVSCGASLSLLGRLRGRPAPAPAAPSWFESEEPEAPLAPPPLPSRRLSPKLFRQRHPALYGLTTPPPEPVRAVADFEPVDAVYLAWTPGVGDEFHLSFIETVLRYTRVKPLVIHHGELEREDLTELLVARRIRPARVTFIDARTLGPYHEPSPDAPDSRAVQTPWVRDWGPLFVRTPRGLSIVDARYWDDRPNDDALPTKLGRWEGRPVYRTALPLEGGNFLTDGNGNCFLADEAELASSEDRDDLTDEALQRYYGCRQVVWLSALSGEHTGHADMFLMVGERDTLLLGHYLPEQDPTNHHLLNENAALLRTVQGVGGRRFRVLRVPMPDNSDDLYRTYLNGLVLNGLVLYPRFPGFEHLEPRVRRAYAEAFPGRRIVGLDVEELLIEGGAIHCATKGRPR